MTGVQKHFFQCGQTAIQQGYGRWGHMKDTTLPHIKSKAGDNVELATVSKEHCYTQRMKGGWGRGFL
jgi:hypothetical protein